MKPGSRINLDCPKETKETNLNNIMYFELCRNLG